MSHQGYYTGSSNFDNVNDLLNEAELYRDQALEYSLDAATSETNAAASAASALTSANNAGVSEANAIAAASGASASTSAAIAAATAAQGSQTAAATSETNAAASAVSASSSASSASSSAATASTAATNASSSASAAATSETNAANSATTASTAATNAGTSATNAANSATAASTSASNASSSASSASSSASAAATSATNAANSATSAAASATAAAASAASLVGRNRIINGKMEFQQRGTSFPAANGYTLDRWSVALGGSGVATVTQQADAPPSNEFRNSLRVAVTTADTSIAATDFALVLQRIEGFNVRDLIGKSFTFSFWVRSPKAGTHCVAFRNATPDRSYVLEYTVNVANTWEYKTVTVAGGLITAGTWDWTNGVGVEAVFVLAAGSNFQTTAGQWQTGNFVATANQVNCLDTVGNIFAITGVQLEVGPVATPFEHRSHGVELQLCWRYYQAYGMFRASQYAGGVATFGAPLPINPPMRATPSVVLGAASVFGNATNIALVPESYSTAYWKWDSLAAGQSFWAIDSTALSAEL